MQAVSSAYKSEQKEYLREEGFVWVYLGVISKEAQAHAKLVDTDLTVYASPRVTGTNEFEAYYASNEENMARLDGTHRFLPRNENAFALFQGIVTQEIMGTVQFSFAPYQHLDIKGLTIDFGDYYPTRFNIISGVNTYTYENDKAGIWTTEDIFRDTASIIIEPLEMVGGQQRLRIHSILFGIGLMFDNKALIATSWKSECSHISGELPSKSFSFTVDNLNRRFAADDPNSYLAFLQEQQEVEFQYGRNLPDGSMVTIPGGKLRLKTWSSDDTQAKFTAVGFLDYTKDKYIKGKYYPEGISLYDLAVDVCQDAGIENYIIDSYLKTMFTHNPLPISTHKNLLQLIANAARSIMRETRDGGIEIKSSFQPEVTSISANDETVYSNVGNLIAEDVMISEYATAEPNFTYVDGINFFLPRDSGSGYVDTGYVSQEVEPIASGDEPCITITWESEWTFFGLSLDFGSIVPKTGVIRGYRGNSLIKEITLSDSLGAADYQIDFHTSINDSFIDVDKLQIEFSEAKEQGQRIHLNRIEFGALTDYVVDYRDMASSPVATVADKIKNVNVAYYEYAYGTEQKKLSTTNAIEGLNEVTFNNPCHGYTLEYADGGSGQIEIIESGAFFVQFTSSRDAEVNINGSEFAVSSKELVEQVKEIGIDKNSANKIIDNLEDAQKQAQWLKEFFSNDVEYLITYRGEPALDPDDLIYTENKYVEKNLVRITSTQIDTSTGMSMNCKLKGRRVRYTMPAIVGQAIVGESEVG